MKVLLVGGGSGGHITPPLSVAKELKKLDSNIEIEFVIERGSKFIDLPSNDPNISKVHQITAGKFRRYHGESLLRRIFDIKTLLLNIIDFFKLGIGKVQSIIKIKRIKPDIVFIKGGFVGVPVGLACAFWRVPFVVHDSDAHPGLANRLVGRWAKLHMVGMPTQYYDYPAEKMMFVGNPVGSDFKAVTHEMQAKYRKNLKIDNKKQVIAVTGGSLGAQRLNEALVPVLSKMSDNDDNIVILHQTGSDKRLYANNDQIIEKKFVDNMPEFIGAADVVIARAGAGTIAELAIQEKPVILVPNPLLTGGHQTINSRHLADQKAVIEVTEDKLNDQHITEAINDLLSNKKLRSSLSRNISKLAKTDSAKIIAKYLYEQKK